MVDARLHKIGADAEDGDVEEFSFDQFPELAHDQGQVVYGESASVDVFLLDFGRQNFAGLGA